jgi:hypothetical protein
MNDRIDSQPKSPNVSFKALPGVRVALRRYMSFDRGMNRRLVKLEKRWSQWTVPANRIEGCQR